MGRKKQFDRDEILEKTAKLFFKKGFADTSLQDLEKSTGVNKSGLYSEFKDKDDLFHSTLKHYISKIPLEDLLLKKPLGWENIEDFLQPRLICDGVKGCLIANSIREASILPSSAKASIQDYLQSLKHMLVENLKGQTKTVSPDVVADIILNYISGKSLEMNLGQPKNIQERNDAFLVMIKSI